MPRGKLEVYEVDVYVTWDREDTDDYEFATWSSRAVRMLLNKAGVLVSNITGHANPTPGEVESMDEEVEVHGMDEEDRIHYSQRWSGDFTATVSVYATSERNAKRLARDRVYDAFDQTNLGWCLGPDIICH